ncbi:MAG: TauD/TfdA family dioxygenase [Gammaproteobacteria bacterium]
MRVKLGTEPSPHRMASERPFDLLDCSAYARWREEKLRDYPSDPSALTVYIADPFALSAAEVEAVTSICRKTNLALYSLRSTSPPTKTMVRALGQQLGLRQLDRNLCADEDGIAAIRVVPEGRAREYIPYSNRAINWHTDGYYNDLRHPVRGIIMHCVCDAAVGGANALLDPEILYILMRDRNPEYLGALSAPDTMTIPGNRENGRLLRPERTGPVFSVHDQDGTLHMRYTARTRSIRWRDDTLTRSAVGLLQELLAGDSPYVLRVRLKPGQGIICNNVLHTREAFSDDPVNGKQRLVLRARYFDRVTASPAYSTPKALASNPKRS